MISSLLDYSFPIVGSQLCLFILLTKFVVEPILMPKWFGSVFTAMNLVDQRSFTNHVVALAIKVVVFIVGAYPWISVFLAEGQYGANANLDSDHQRVNVKHGINVTLGDLLGWSHSIYPLRCLTCASLVLPRRTYDVLV